MPPANHNSEHEASRRELDESRGGDRSAEAEPPLAAQEPAVAVQPEPGGASPDPVSSQDAAQPEKTDPPSGPSARSVATDTVEDDEGPALAIPPEMIAKFASEAADQLDALESLLLRLEDEPNAVDVVGEAFREIHSFKGNCGFLGYRQLESVSHLMEDILAALKAASRPRDETAISVLLRGVDGLRQSVVNLTVTHGEVVNYNKIVSDLRGMAKRPSHEIGQPSRDTLAAVAETLIREGRVRPEEIPELLERSQRAGAAASPTGRSEPSDPSVTEAPDPSPPSIEPGEEAETTSASGGAQTARYIRVEINKLDTLLNQVGELINAAASITHHPDVKDLKLERFGQATGQLNRITSGLHDTSMAMRMVPLSATFRKMQRVVRDVSRKLGKEVDLKIEGEETEVDKNVIESIADPLVHIVRNAVDHGIEAPSERAQAGKPPAGRLALVARHQGGEVWLEVSDDGRGIDSNRVMQKALSRALVAPDHELSEDKILQLIFEPGFSTAEQVTDISGRGVGMDVVRRNIEAMRGRVEVQSRLGRGTTFIIRLPLTLAIIDSMLLRVGPSVCALPLTAVHESFRPDSCRFSKLPNDARMVHIRGRTFPILQLESLYGAAWRTVADDSGILVLVEDQGTAFCLAADEIVGQRQIVVKPLDKYLKTIRGISGCSILGSGEICLILDVANLARDVPTRAANCLPRDQPVTPRVAEVLS
ncbi:MAG: hypothetical protein B7733_19880 [Myxococcales bacterium FL481]|nr:MAG: hypothetical protein B7733_19880 [Myxococcales bacterium FL481]